MSLGEYLKKRQFATTPEPAGKVKSKKRTSSHKLAFVVQQHQASRMHYDFRLELDGVLKSWAVPKGPSLNPHDHHLAVHVEDHPYDYRTFEGVIPEGNYGAGNVIIWDEGWYTARQGDPADSEATLRREYKKGHMTFVVYGSKLRGEFALIKMHESKIGDDAWLLIKKGDEFATEKTDILRQDESIKSGKQVDELGGTATLPDLADYPARKRPWQVTPMLCTLVDEAFSRDGWLFEVKWDGYRAIGSKHADAIELYSRAHTDFSSHYPPVVEALHALDHDVILDGEIVVVDDEGNPHFEWLQNWRKVPSGNLHYYAFDILWCDGRDVRDMPLLQRKQLLKGLLPSSGVLRYSDHVETKGSQLFRQMQARHLEGMVAKRADSHYGENERGRDWLKVKTHLRQEVVIGGYTEPRGSRQYLGALVVGVYDQGELHYAGHSGGGIPDDQRKLLHDRLAKIERKTSPFVVEPKPNAPVHWVRPEIVCEMSFSEWTQEGSMRQPQFKGLRDDKKATAVHREKPTSAARQAAPADTLSKPAKTVKKLSAPDQPEFTHLNKVFFPKSGYTKGDLIKYYESVADYILPYLADRPCSMLRMPQGINGEGFFQKNNEHLPDWVPHADIYSESNKSDLHWIVGGQLNTLLYMVQLGCIEINPWNSRVGHQDKPDWIVIDLDPEGVDFKKVIKIAQLARIVCDEWGIPTYPKTSGKTGIHLYIPMGAAYTYEQAKNLAHLIVIEINKRDPKVTSIERLPKKRHHKIYLDYLQNRSGQTLAAPYSVRPTPTATVSTPLHWDEVTKDLKPTDFTIKNIGARLKREGDIWKPVMGKEVDLKSVLKQLSDLT